MKYGAVMEVKMNRFRTYGTIYRECLRSSLRQASAYKTNFIISLFVNFLGYIGLPVVTALIYKSGAGFPGWNFHEVIFIQSLFLVSNGMNGIFFSNVIWQTMDHIREGNFEIVLLKPVSPLFFLVSRSFNLDSLGGMTGGLVLCFLTLPHLQGITAASTFMFLLMFSGGLAVQSGFSLLMAATSFIWVGNSRLHEIFESVASFGRYPVSIFPQAVRFFSTFIIPVGMIAFYPASILLGKSSFLFLPALIPCIAFFLVSKTIYNRMIKLYEGVGG